MTESMNAKAYKQQFLELQSYVGDVPREICNSLGRCSAKFDEAECCVILSNTVTQLQQNNLVSCGGRLTTKQWKEIAQEHKQEKLLAKLIKFKEDSTGGEKGNRKKRNDRGQKGGGTGNPTNNQNDDEDPRGNTNSPRQECKDCGSTHPGCCNKQLGWINDPKNSQNKNKNSGWRDKNKKVSMTTKQLNIILSEAH